MPTETTTTDPVAPDLLRQADAAEFAQLFWAHCVRINRWHGNASAAAAPVPAHLGAQLPLDLDDIEHPLWHLLDQLHFLLIGYQPELGPAAMRALESLHARLQQTLAVGWAEAAAAVAALQQQDQTRQQRIEQRLIDTAHGQVRSQRARQQATQLLNRCMAGKKLAADIVAWLQGEWFGELQWCLLQHGDGGAAWHRRADITLALVASLQVPGDDNRQHLYTQIARINTELRELLGERAVSPAAVDDILGRIEQQHLLLLKGQTPAAASFALLAADATWFADISLSREMRTRVDALRPGQWFLLREDDGDRRVKLILKQDEVGQLLFANQLGLKALQISVEEFAYRLSAEMAVPLPPFSGARQALLETLTELGGRRREAEQVQREEEAALEQRRAEVRERVEFEARQRAQARAKAAAEARALAEAQAHADALAQAQAAEAYTEARQREQARRRDVLARQPGDGQTRQRLARQQAATLAIGHWLELRDETGSLQRLKLAVKLPTSGKLILVDREGIRRAELSREQLVDYLLEGSAQLTDQGPQFEDTLARVVNGLRRDRHRES